MTARILAALAIVVAAGLLLIGFGLAMSPDSAPAGPRVTPTTYGYPVR